MWFTGITLLLVSLAFLGSAADEECKNGTRPDSQKDGEGCDYYCMNNSTNNWDHFFYGDGEKCFYKEGNLKGTCKEGSCVLDEDQAKDNPNTTDDGDGKDNKNDDDDDDGDDEEQEKRKR
uniref:Putative basic tail protein n=1 Tax=Ixodes ricinus TaxID=34613 RepID=A0A0K8RIM5_IXORI